MSEQAEHLQSALSILEYGCDYGDFDNEVAAVKQVLAERDVLRAALAEIAADETPSRPAFDLVQIARRALIPFLPDE